MIIQCVLVFYIKVEAVVRMYLRKIITIESLKRYMEYMSALSSLPRSQR